MLVMSTASFDIKFSTPFCVVSRSGFRVQSAQTLEEIVANTLGYAGDMTCAIYGEGECNRISIQHADSRGVTDSRSVAGSLR